MSSGWVVVSIVALVVVLAARFALSLDQIPAAGPEVLSSTAADFDRSGSAAPTARPAPVFPGGALVEIEGDSLVESDPNFEGKMLFAGISPNGWNTDFSRHIVPYTDIVSGGPLPDGIPPIDDPTFVAVEDAASWLGDQEPVISLELDGDARAYPLQIMTWHEIVNDGIGGVPVVVTFCPLCNSAIVFDRRLDGEVYDFGTSGKLRYSDLLMYDRQTHSWWQEFTGEGIVGELSGKRLTFLPASIVSYSDFAAAHPDGMVLSRDTGFRRPYGQNPYLGYDRIDNPPFLLRGASDGRLPPKERVVAVTIGEVDVAFPFAVLEQERVVNYTVNDEDLVVFVKPGTASAFDGSLISAGRDIGATGVFSAHLNGRRLTFRADGDKIVDDETGSLWNILGKAVEGPLPGSELEPIVHGDHFWFAWGVFKPDTKVYEGTG